MERFVTFTNKQKAKTILLNSENTFLRLTKLIVRPIDIEKDTIFFNPISITYRINKADTSYETNSLFELSTHSFKHDQQIIKLDKTISESSMNMEVEIFFECEENFTCEVDLHFTHFDKKVDLKDPLKDFADHIKIHDNAKILFSGPFGQGKTTFLSYFFEEQKNEYEVFKLYPVNYAVSHNEDIFKYIKAEILFQLMGKDVEFDKIHFNYSEVAYSYFSQNSDKIISPLLSLIPKIGETVAKVFDKIYELSKVLKEYKTQLDTDDEQKALDFIKELYEKEGSIFEDNFYTRLIRQLLTQQKQKKKKKNVLIIDDIDRMDPDHIFRIFNVFSANFDSPDYLEGLSNKFGFDKIILVCDYDNIRKIFRHRYGNSAAFDGYLSKYYSRNPFYYDNEKALEFFTDKIAYNKYDRVTLLGESLIVILKDLVATGELTLRDLLKLQKFELYDAVNKLADNHSRKLKNQKHKFLFFNTIAFLENIYELETIQEKIARCKIKVKEKERVNYNYYSQIALAALTNSTGDLNLTKIVQFQGQRYTFNVEEKSDLQNINFDYLHTTNLAIFNNNSKVEFNEKDFYELLLLNIEKYGES